MNPSQLWFHFGCQISTPTKHSSKCVLVRKMYSRVDGHDAVGVTFNFSFEVYRCATQHCVVLLCYSCWRRSILQTSHWKHDGNTVAQTIAAWYCISMCAQPPNVSTQFLYDANLFGKGQAPDFTKLWGEAALSGCVYFWLRPSISCGYCRRKAPLHGDGFQGACLFASHLIRW